MVKNGWSKVDIYSNYLVFMILSEHEFQVVSIFQSKCIVEYKYELYGQKRATTYTSGLQVAQSLQLSNAILKIKSYKFNLLNFYDSTNISHEYISI